MSPIFKVNLLVMIFLFVSCEPTQVIELDNSEPTNIEQNSDNESEIDIEEEVEVVNVKLEASLLLAGAYDSNLGEMKTNFAANGELPQTQPFFFLL